MTILKPIYFVSLLVLALLSTAVAQESTRPATQTASLIITANASADRVRVTAPSSVVQVRLEVYAATGEKLFDEELRGANVFDWHVQDGQAQRLPAGDYVCVVTAKTISGKLAQKIGAVSIAEKSASVRAGDSQQFTSPQAQAIGPVEADSSWTVVADGDNKTTTVIANNGSEGQMIRGRGALTFRLGDFFGGKDEEQMRLTEEGNLGIGTSTPQAKLDVNGAIRAERFLVVKRGTSESGKTAAATEATDGAESVQPLVAGTGTQNQIAKWTDNAGTLGDSVITETAAGKVGLGIASPLSKFHVGGNFDALRMTSLNDTTPVWGQFNTSAGSGLGYFGVEGKTAGTFLAGTLPYATALSSGASGTALQLGSAGSVKLTISSGGNVGIGTSSPQQNLSVNGAMNVDQANLNGGSFNPGISFGSGSGESIASNRILSGSHNQFGLDFYTNFLNRMSITNGGNVGIGTTNPGAPLDVQVAVGQSLQFRQDGGLVPGINVKTTGGNAGIMRLRNSLEVWPSDDTTRAGKVDVRDTSGSPTITLDGQTGNVSFTGDASFRNMPGIRFGQSQTDATISPGTSVPVDTVTINAPAAGFIFVSADVDATTVSGGNQVLDFTLSKGGTFVVNSKYLTKINNGTIGSDSEVPIHLSWVIPVSNAGSIQLDTSLYYDNNGFVDKATLKRHNLTAIYLPKQY